MDVLSPQAQNRSPIFCMTRVFFLLQKPLHLLCQFPLYNSSLLDSKPTPEIRFYPYFFCNLSKICHSLLYPHRQISYSCAMTRRLLQQSFSWLVSTVLGKAEGLHSPIEWTIHLERNFSSTTCLFSYNPLQTLSEREIFAVKYLPRQSSCFCCWPLPHLCQ